MEDPRPVGTDRGPPQYVCALRTWLIEPDRALDWDDLSPHLGRIVTNYGGALLWSNGLSMKVDEVHDNKGNDSHSD